MNSNTTLPCYCSEETIFPFVIEQELLYRRNLFTDSHSNITNNFFFVIHNNEKLERLFLFLLNIGFIWEVFKTHFHDFKVEWKDFNNKLIRKWKRIYQIDFSLYKKCFSYYLFKKLYSINDTICKLQKC